MGMGDDIGPQNHLPGQLGASLEGLPITKAPSKNAKSWSDVRKVEYRKRNRQLKRREAALAVSSCYKLHPSSYKFEEQHMQYVDWKTGGAPVSSSAFIGRPLAPGEFKMYLGRSLDHGLRLVEWDGRTRTAIADGEGRIVVALAGCPADPDWPEVVKGAKRAFDHARRRSLEEGILGANSACPRGPFLQLSYGVSHGGGQKAPSVLLQPRGASSIVQELVEDKAIRRIAGFQSSCFAFFAPKIYREFEETLFALLRRHPELPKPFFNSIFPAVSFNLGPQTVCMPHRDTKNVPHGFCPVTSAGTYNSKSGGHLVLWDMKLVIEFPPGSTILIPSAIITHSNTEIQHGETRISMTQYCAGGLFRWVQYGFQTRKSLVLAKNGPERAKEVDGRRGERWKLALDLFSKPGEATADRKLVFQP